MKVRLFACADTLSAFTTFTSSVTKELSPDMCVLTQCCNGHCLPSTVKRLLSPLPSASTHLTTKISWVTFILTQHRQFLIFSTVSLDEEAFSRLSGLGSTADMINDDLPTNADYLDVSYGAAGGFRELEETDLLDFETRSLSNVDGVISDFGGETVRILDAKKITVIENYFENIVPESMDTVWYVFFYSDIHVNPTKISQVREAKDENPGR